MTNSNRTHERYEEMCAIAAIGELSESECSEFQTHLVVCGACQQTYRDFCLVSAEYLGSVAAQSLAESGDTERGPDPEDLLSKCLARAAVQDAERVPNPVLASAGEKRSFFSILRGSSRGRRIAFALAGIVVAAASGLAGFALRQHELQLDVSDLRDRLARRESLSANTNLAQQKSKRPEGADAVVQSLAKKEEDLKNLIARYARLSKEKRQIEDQLSSATTLVQQLRSDAQNYQTRLKQEGVARSDLQTRLGATQARLNGEEQTVADLNQRLRGKTEEVADLAATYPPGVTDDEAKRLFGARDLHIVDVYDVDGRGQTRRGFGRVYYVEKKLLLFYAFDLEDGKHNRAPVAFQGWGYKEANAGAPQNLGLFYVDDVSLHRWVLKVDNPKVLERVNVVFVTAEPPHGSSAPNGRRLLYANLGGAPNHP
jgi:hypothetical protein